MSITVKDVRAEELARELARLDGVTMTAAVRSALEAAYARRVVREAAGGRAERLQRVLEEEIWPMLGIEGERAPLSKAERERILGYGPHGV